LNNERRPEIEAMKSIEHIWSSERQPSGCEPPWLVEQVKSYTASAIRILPRVGSGHEPPRALLGSDARSAAQQIDDSQEDEWGQDLAMDTNQGSCLMSCS
jgi:hypothetical protein